MARVLLLPVAAVVVFLSCVSVTAGTAAATAFIRSSCRATTYPDVCVTSLAEYGPAIKESPQNLVQTALSVSLKRANSTKAFVNRLCKTTDRSKSLEYGPLKDCLDQISDSMDRITKSVGELKKMGRAQSPEFLLHVSNAQTWVSAALTDQTTCMDGFEGRAFDRSVKAPIRAQVNDLARVTSNALALINKFVAKYN
ncbi:unnamed protein product [Cuscuta campestris]|uniref:Pectinesterase inhibitor domain-containing protein n=1 Tax=Cuscuta campestris TaxID=132261 RepID=A0A484LX67_9ASTE|nr:unnamed protein product [Cuscuta campestris]